MPPPARREPRPAQSRCPARIAPVPLRDWLVAQRITISFVPSALAEAVMALDWPPETALHLLLTGAETPHHYPSPRLPFAVVNNYGPTESTVVTTSGPVPPLERPARLPSIGRSITNTQVIARVADTFGVDLPLRSRNYSGGSARAPRARVTA